MFYKHNQLLTYIVLKNTSYYGNTRNKFRCYRTKSDTIHIQIARAFSKIKKCATKNIKKIQEMSRVWKPNKNQGLFLTIKNFEKAKPANSIQISDITNRASNSTQVNYINKGGMQAN